MTIIALQGIRGGVGTTSITASLAWALRQLGDTVLAIDFSPDNLLRLHFNTAWEDSRGWARSVTDGLPWQQGALRYADRMDFLPFGQLNRAEQERRPAVDWPDSLKTLGASGDYRWILLDIPAGYTPLSDALTALADLTICPLVADTNCHVRLHQQALPPGARLLVNQLAVANQLQDDIYQLWLQSVPDLLPLAVHRDAAMSESAAAKQPVGEYRPECLAAEELTTLANWCLLHTAGVAL
ncbi:cellulose biosynthesis protein BcsQ [Enterobacillus tribolii]|uniref:Cell division protein YhjQ n=1 Tax=Enterobacillus tribolii TaxID=1487935 RepID=A0A370QU91_9GAMM|nr:cellulose biosynthesis protein BcsQ [Enterobacillus tribolii]MBW7981132.1 cellulose synthase operon protein YhjQ [Enterobacillus tribolii]RDK92810.1 cell division protein YhjQ [Enterobacillus tribolii]